MELKNGKKTCFLFSLKVSGIVPSAKKASNVFEKGERNR